MPRTRNDVIGVEMVMVMEMVMAVVNDVKHRFLYKL